MEEADVFLVHIDVHETTHGAGFIDEALLDPGEARLQFRDGVAHGCGVDFDESDEANIREFAALIGETLDALRVAAGTPASPEVVL